MIYRFTLISDEVDDFVREIQIDPEATFYDFHEAIVKSVGYTNDQMTSFFICDDDWEKKGNYAGRNGRQSGNGQLGNERHHYQRT